MCLFAEKSLEFVGGITIISPFGHDRWLPTAMLSFQYLKNISEGTREAVEVVSPVSFRNELRNIVYNMNKTYKKK